MLNLISQKIVNRLIKNNTISSDFADVYIYGFSLLISNLIGFSTVLLISNVFHCVLNGVCFLFIIATLRTHTGGYHAKNYLSCNLVLNFSFLLCLFAAKFLPQNNFAAIFSEIFTIFLTIIIIIIFIPIENQNKPILKSRKIYKLKSLALYLIYYLIGIYLYLNNLHLGNFILTTLNFSALLIIFELIRRRFIYE